MSYIVYTRFYPEYFFVIFWRILMGENVTEKEDALFKCTCFIRIRQNLVSACLSSKQS